jgi:hypothetical protein
MSDQQAPESVMREIGGDVGYTGPVEWHYVKLMGAPALVMVAAAWFLRFQLPGMPEAADIAPIGVLQGLGVAVVVIMVLTIIGAVMQDVMLHKLMNAYERIALRVDEALAGYDHAIPVRTLWLEAFPREQSGKGGIDEPPSWFTDYLRTALTIGEVSSDAEGASIYANGTMRSAVWARRQMRARYYDSLRRSGSRR